MPGWLRERRLESLRYEIRISKRPGPRDVSLLQRAFARVAIHWRDTVGAIEVMGPSESFVVVMDVVGSPGPATRECERLFALAWYDAFGVRGSPHIGRFVQGPAARRVDTLAS